MATKFSQADWARARPALKRVGTELKGPCPACGGTDRFRVNADGRAFCRKCCPNSSDPTAFQRILDAAGLNAPYDADSGRERRATSGNGKDPASNGAELGTGERKPFTAPRNHTGKWTYRGPDGLPVGVVFRIDRDDGNKDFRQASINAKGSMWLPAPKKWPLAKFELLEHHHADRDVIIVEGEKALDALYELLGDEDQAVTCWAGGAVSGALRKTDFSPLKGRNVILWPDNDKPGLAIMRELAALSHSMAKSLRIVDPTRLAPKADAADVDKDTALALLAKASPYEFADTAPDAGDPERKLTEVEAAQILYEKMRGKRVYDSRKKVWRRLRHGRLWVEDTEGARRDAVRIVTESRPDSRGMQRRHSLNNALAIAADEVGMYSYEWDTSGDLCTPGGIINCEKGTWHPGAQDPDARHTRSTPVDPDMDAEPTLWLKYLYDATGGNEDMIRDLQRFLGYTLTADTHAEQFYVLVGPPRTGKTTFIKTVEYIMGGYVKTVSVERLTGRFQAHRQWMAGLDGARLVICTEPPPSGAVWKSGELSSFVSGETQEANFMRANSFNFRPIAKLWIAVNGIPRASGPNSGILRRIVPIPFTIIVPKNKKDKTLIEKLKAEAPAILGWILKGLKQYRKHGMGTLSQSVRDQQGEYAAAQDDVNRWIMESGDVVADLRGVIAKGKAHKLYSQWCDSEGIKPLTLKVFGTRLKQLPGISEDNIRIEGKQTRVWTGLDEVKPLDERNPPPPDDVPE